MATCTPLSLAKVDKRQASFFYTLKPKRYYTFASIDFVDFFYVISGCLEIEDPAN